MAGRHAAPRPRRSHHAVVAGVAVVTACLLTGGALAIGAQQGQGPGAPHPSASGRSDAGAAAAARAPGFQDPAPASTAAAASAPVQVSIPAIGVASDLESLHLDGTGALLPPADFGSAGWYAEGVAPGQIGSAIIAGHVDSAAGPAVFAKLGDLRPGDRVQVRLADGRELSFEVFGSVQSAKAQFPTSEVYGPVPDAELRLITCTGVFDRSTGHYLDNLIVFAREVSAG